MIKAIIHGFIFWQPWTIKSIPNGAKMKTDLALAEVDQSKKEKDAGIKAKYILILSWLILGSFLP